MTDTLAPALASEKRAARDTPRDVRAFNEAVQKARDHAEQHLPELEAVYLRILNTAAREAAKGFAAQVVAAAWVPPPEGNIQILDATYYRALLGPLQRRVLRGVAGAVSSAAGISFSIRHPVTAAMLSKTGMRIGAALDAAVQPILRETIADGFAQGLSVKDTADNIRMNIKAAAPAQARMLARTDLNGLANAGSVAAAKVAGIGYKQWLTAEDDRVREEHIDADGQTVPVDQPFTVCGEDLDFPGDPAGSDACVANCRCTVIYLDSDQVGGGEGEAETLTAPAQTLDVHPDEKFLARLDAKFRDSWGYVGAREHAMSLAEYERELLSAVQTKVAESDIRIRTPIDVADKILADGRFVSQFESGTSKGILNNSLRADAEETLYGYKDIPAAERPIYGYLSASEGETSLNSYGEVSWTLKPEARVRTTFTADDSLGMRTLPSPVQDPSVLSVPAPRYSTTPDPLDTARITDHAEFVDKWNAYWEAQIHGGVALDDVASVDLWDALQPRYDYPGAPPATPHEWAASLRNKLEERGIAVRLHENSAYVEVRK